MGMTDVPTAVIALLSSAAEQRDAPPAIANHLCRSTSQHKGARRLAASARFRLRAQEQQPGRD
jgi:hypothetical protein